MTAAAAASPARAGRLDSVQYLRAIAALLVVVYHVQPRLERMGWEGGWPGWLSSGVDIFFVISGFIMWVTTAERPTTPGQFLWHRFVRIAPMYYLVTAVMVALIIAVPSIAGGGRLSGWHLLGSYAFWPLPQPNTGRFEPVLAQGWTLNYEMFFYVLFALALLLAPMARLVTLVVALLAIVVAGVVIAPEPGVLHFYTDGIILEFAYGLLIGAAFTSGRQLPRALSLVLILAGFIAVPLLYPFHEVLPRQIMWGLPAAAIVGGAVFAERARAVVRSSLMLLLGNASYSLYLCHGLVLSAFAYAWTKLHLGGQGVQGMAFAALAIVVACLAGVALYRFVEVPLTRLLRPRKAAKAPRLRSVSAPS